MNGIDLALIAVLRETLGERGVASDDKGAPILRPASTAEVSQVLKVCNDASQPIVPIGGRTGLVHGTDRAPGELGLSLERLNAIDEIDEVGQTMTVGAGVPVQTAQEAAEAKGLMFPLDLGARGSAMVGGAIATNAGGNRVIRYGMTREMVLALEAVLADGTIIPLQPKVIKNNTGYDLKQLFIGSEGTLAIVTRAVLRLRPLPKALPCAFVSVPNFPALGALLNHMQRASGGALSSFEVLWADWYAFITGDTCPHKPPLPHGEPYYVLIEMVGTDRDTEEGSFENLLSDAFDQNLIADAIIAKSQAERDKLWDMRDDVFQIDQYAPFFVFDVSVAISDMESLSQEVDERLTRELGPLRVYTFGHLGDGNVHFVIAADRVPDVQHADINTIIYDAVGKRQGSVSAEHGIGLEKKSYLIETRSEQEIELMRTLKRTLDPKNILNPGKIFDMNP